MREQTSRLDRYLRVAYDPDGAAPRPGGGGPVARAPGRWAVRPAVAVRLAAVLLVLAVAGATLLLLSQQASPAPAAPVADPIGAAASPAAVAGSSPAGSGEETADTPTVTAVVVVHVAGAVANPGVVELPPGTRVDEAIQAAGGATSAADLDALNLAAPLVDGQQVYVPEEGEVAPQAGTGPPTGGTGGAGAATLVDINTADAAALETLPGIGPALAERIVTWRSENGPFASVDSLTDVSGIGPATMERLRDLVTV